MGGAAATYQMPVDPSSAMASTSQSQDALQAMNLGSAQNFNATKAIKPINAHPEAVAMGAIEGAKSLISSVGSAYAGGAGGATGAGGFTSAAAAKQAAPHAAGVSNVPGVGYVPQAQGVNYQPDQLERTYGYGYGNL